MNWKCHLKNVELKYNKNEVKIGQLKNYLGTLFMDIRARTSII